VFPSDWREFPVAFLRSDETPDSPDISYNYFIYFDFAGGPGLTGPAGDKFNTKTSELSASSDPNIYILPIPVGTPFPKTDADGDQIPLLLGIDPNLSYILGNQITVTDQNDPLLNSFKAYVVDYNKISGFLTINNISDVMGDFDVETTYAVNLYVPGPRGPTGATGQTGASGDRYKTTSSSVTGSIASDFLIFTVDIALSYSPLGAATERVIIYGETTDFTCIGSVSEYDPVLGKISVTSFTNVAGIFDLTKNYNINLPSQESPVAPTSAAKTPSSMSAQTSSNKTPSSVRSRRRNLTLVN
jgi:hypothetical protein